MAEASSYGLDLAGCRPEPLMAYLKALGILRLVGEQKDADARGYWKNDVFRLRSTLDRDALVKFFLEEYKPTPIVVPWSGGDFFSVNWSPPTSKYAETPTASKAIEAILATTTPRLAPYRKALQACKAVRDACKINTKAKMGKQKWAFIQTLRSTCEETGVIEWMDAAAVGTVERFAALLGSGGGSDGNTHFSDNFMQNLWDVLPDFDAQREVGKKNGQGPSTNDMSTRFLRSALYEDAAVQLIQKRTSSLYDSGAVGGPNATQGMERDSLANPWNVILALEGTIAFAGAATKRLGANTQAQGAFPFQVSASVTTQDGLAGKEEAGTEVWLPLWTRPARSNEVLALLREGRAQCGTRPAGTGVDMARSVASLGVDRGIRAFGRYAILKGRVGGNNYNTAASLGRFKVQEQREADLLRQIDQWLDSFRRAAGDKNAPPRFGRALRAIDSTIFDFCKYGGAAFFQEIIVALGRAERELAGGERFRKKKDLKPLAGLSADWISAADDNSPEFSVACALASVHDPARKIGPLRVNLEPVTLRYDKEAGGQKANWAEKDRAVVWNAADLTTNLANVLARRMMDGTRAGCERLPLSSCFTASPEHIAAFVAGDLDDRRIEELIWGLMLVDMGGNPGRNPDRNHEPPHDRPVPRDYALLKLLFLPRPLAFDQKADGRLSAHLQRRDETGGIAVRPEPRILPLLRSGRVGEACRIAARRLRVSGLPPMPGPLPNGIMRDNIWSEQTANHRLAAALLIPISDNAVNTLVRLVIRGNEVDNDQVHAVAATTFEGGTPS